MYAALILSICRAIIDFRGRLSTSSTFLIIFGPFPFALPVDFRVIWVLKERMKDKL
jgi:hypothetical protein